MKTNKKPSLPETIYYVRLGSHHASGMAILDPHLSWDYFEEGYAIVSQEFVKELVKRLLPFAQSDDLVVFTDQQIRDIWFFGYKAGISTASSAIADIAPY